VVRQTKYAIKYAVDIAANNTRNLMEKEAKSKFSLSKPWTSAKQPSGYRARNSYVNGKIAPDIPTSGFDRRTGDILAAAYSGERNYWAKRQNEGGDASKTSPLYAKAGGKIVKTRGGANKRFQKLGVGEVFGKRGNKTKSRGGLDKLYDQYGRGKHKRFVAAYFDSNGKLKMDKNFGADSTIGLIDYNAFRRRKKTKAFTPMFYRGRNRFKTDKLTAHEQIFKKEKAKVLVNVRNRLRGNLVRSAQRQARITTFHLKG
jgi:hypothetical protein